MQARLVHKVIALLAVGWLALPSDAANFGSSFPAHWLGESLSGQECDDISGDFFRLGERWPHEAVGVIYEKPWIEIFAFLRGVPRDAADFARVSLDRSGAKAQIDSMSSTDGEKIVLRHRSLDVTCADGWWTYKHSSLGHGEGGRASHEWVVRLRLDSHGALVAHRQLEVVTGLIFKEESRTDVWTRFQRRIGSTIGQ